MSDGPTMDNDEPDMVTYMKALVDLERGGERSTLMIGPYTAITIVGAIQLATRHPGLKPAERARLRQIVDGFKPWFEGTLGEEIIRRGEHPEFDC